MVNTERQLPAVLRAGRACTDCAPYFFYTPATIEVSEEEMVAFAQTCRALGAGGIVPRLAVAAKAYREQHRLPQPIAASQQAKAQAERLANDRAVDAALLDFYRRVYRTLIGAGLPVAFHAEETLQEITVRSLTDEVVWAYMLTRREYTVAEKERTALRLSQQGVRMAVVAVDLRDGETIDLRGFVDGEGTLHWDVPSGNWCIQEFLCCHDPLPHADYLSADASGTVLEAAYAKLADLYGAQGAPLLYISDIGFHAPNHRSWSPDFNARFAELYGMDPAPLYPQLYEIEQEQTKRVKALLFSTRAIMLREGVYRALERFGHSHGMRLLGNVQEPKFAAPSGLSGDAVANAAVLPGALLDRGTLYGLNSLKIAAAGAYNYGGTIVSCEIGRDDPRLSRKRLLVSAINAMARGANRITLHGAERSDGPDAACVDWIRRSCAILQQGRHRSDIGVVYPIHSLHSAVSFYEIPETSFPYPDLPTSADYTSTINSLAFYAGVDVTLLHPDVLRTRATVKDGCLLLPDGQGGEAVFSVLILPASRLLHPDVMRLVLTFFRAGGKIIATGEQLPTQAFASLTRAEQEDGALTQALREVFGSEALQSDVVAGVLYHGNEHGGRACWMYPGKTAADGTMMVDSAALSRVLYAFELPLAVYIPGMPRRHATGLLGSPYPEYAALGADDVLCAGVPEYHHRETENGHIYFFGNSTDEAFAGEVYLRGEHRTLWLYDPAADACEPLPFTRVDRHGTSYCRVWLTLDGLSARFILAE